MLFNSEYIKKLLQCNRHGLLMKLMKDNTNIWSKNDYMYTYDQCMSNNPRHAIICIFMYYELPDKVDYYECMEEYITIEPSTPINLNLYRFNESLVHSKHAIDITKYRFHKHTDTFKYEVYDPKLLKFYVKHEVINRSIDSFMINTKRVCDVCRVPLYYRIIDMILTEFINCICCIICNNRFYDL